ncbi:hypothetical protein SS50377_27065 [Spironucleus salmonicida]|uniref:Uncharacterized protein n=1 Tax=Spironucleus salmonicida TaxID=348837 RepID=V6LUX1_9EUKA|nr:hypothetical protein SS50377_27065 [Spironucleus salmonicida]|eukprot:EST48048.1 Hypothetical protein SS50377_11814 [Spironucleus salmonicida]
MNDAIQIKEYAKELNISYQPPPLQIINDEVLLKINQFILQNTIPVETYNLSLKKLDLYNQLQKHQILLKYQSPAQLELAIQQLKQEILKNNSKENTHLTSKLYQYNREINKPLKQISLYDAEKAISLNAYYQNITSFIDRFNITTTNSITQLMDIQAKMDNFEPKIFKVIQSDIGDIKIINYDQRAQELKTRFQASYEKHSKLLAENQNLAKKLDFHSQTSHDILNYDIKINQLNVSLFDKMQLFQQISLLERLNQGLRNANFFIENEILLLSDSFKINEIYLETLIENAQNNAVLKTKNDDIFHVAKSLISQIFNFSKAAQTHLNQLQGVAYSQIAKQKVGNDLLQSDFLETGKTYLGLEKIDFRGLRVLSGSSFVYGGDIPQILDVQGSYFQYTGQWDRFLGRNNLENGLFGLYEKLAQDGAEMTRNRELNILKMLHQGELEVQLKLQNTEIYYAETMNIELDDIIMQCQQAKRTIE